MKKSFVKNKLQHDLLCWLFLVAGIFIAFNLHAQLTKKTFKLPFLAANKEVKKTSIKTVKKEKIENKEVAKTFEKVLPILSKKETEKPIVKKETKSVKTEPVKETSEPNVVVSNELLTLEQPKFEEPILDGTESVLKPQIQLPTLPTIGMSETPEMPPMRVFNDAPGGNVLVIGLLLNDQGYVINTRILIYSKNALNDLAFATTVMGKQWTNIVPPLSPGEERWIEFRTQFDEKEDSISIIP